MPNLLNLGIFKLNLTRIYPILPNAKFTKLKKKLTLDSRKFSLFTVIFQGKKSSHKKKWY